MGGYDFSRYLTHSNEDERWRILCTDAGKNDIGPQMIYPPHLEDHPLAFNSVATGRTLNEYQIIYVTRGSGTFVTVDTRYEVRPGSLFIVFPGVRHAYSPDFAVGWSEYWVGFTGPHVDSLRENGIISPEKPFFNVGIHNTLMSLFSAIFEKVKSQEPLFQFKITATILQLIAEVLSLERLSEQQTRAQQVVEQSKSVLEENIYGSFNMKHLSDRVGLSMPHLGGVFKSYTGMTPNQYFINLKLNKAKEFLESGGVSIKEIAYRLGFEDQYYFSRLFKNKTGVSPTLWTRYPSGGA